MYVRLLGTIYPHYSSQNINSAHAYYDTHVDEISFDKVLCDDVGLVLSTLCVCVSSDRIREFAGADFAAALESILIGAHPGCLH